MRTIPFTDIAGCSRAHEDYYEACDSDGDGDRPLSPAQKRKMMAEELAEMDMAFEIGDRSF